jgi:pimeloyl-ACP methyl ester carboxylesterase
MKKNILLLLLIFPFYATAQQYDWGALIQKIDVRAFAGKKFKIEAAVKVELIDSTAEAEIWVRVEKPNKEIGFFYNMMDKPIRDRNWKKVSIKGKIDKGAAWLFFGGIYRKKGIFYFDDFKLTVETSKNKFDTILLPNAGFESDSLSPAWTYTKLAEGFTPAVTASEMYEGKQSCRVDGSAFKPGYEYGSNSNVGKYITANGIKLYYETYGQGAPLLLLHGNSGSIKSFRAQIASFAKYYTVIAVDTRGQGKSSEDGREYTYDLFAEDMNAFLNQLGLDSAYIVGWSDGGNTGLIMAMKYPNKVKKLVAMGANIFIDKTVVDKWIFKELNHQLKELEGDTTAWAKNRVRLVHLLQNEPRHTYDDLKKITCPVLVLAGEKDLIKEEHTKAVAANITNSTLLIAPGKTHYYPEEDAAGFNKTVLTFFGAINSDITK